MCDLIRSHKLNQTKGSKSIIHLTANYPVISDGTIWFRSISIDFDFSADIELITSINCWPEIDRKWTQQKMTQKIKPKPIGYWTISTLNQFHRQIPGRYPDCPPLITKWSKTKLKRLYKGFCLKMLGELKHKNQIHTVVQDSVSLSH